jgi:flagellar biosynthesis/type III secretory pathway protein FliH
VERPWTSARSRARILPAATLAARDEARELVSAAESRAADLVAEAGQAAEEIRSAARDAGRDEGLAYAQRLLVEIQQARLRSLEAGELRRTAAELALEMTRRVLGESWSTEPGTWARAVLEAAAPLRRARAISLRVSPSSAPAVRAQLSPELASGTVELIEDPAIDQPGCIAVSDCGRVDGLLATMLAAFRGPLGVEDGR